MRILGYLLGLFHGVWNGTFPKHDLDVDGMQNFGLFKFNFPAPQKNRRINYMYIYIYVISSTGPLTRTSICMCRIPMF